MYKNAEMMRVDDSFKKSGSEGKEIWSNKQALGFLFYFVFLVSLLTWEKCIFAYMLSRGCTGETT